MKKKVTVAMVLLAIGFAMHPVTAHAQSDFSKDSVVDKAGDWFATLGKESNEKDQILMQRRAERIAKRMQGAIKNESKAAGKEMKKAGQEMEKMFK